MGDPYSDFPRAKGLDPEVLIRLNVLTTNNATRQASLGLPP